MSEHVRHSILANLAEQRRTAEPYDAVTYISRARKLAAGNPPAPPGKRPPTLSVGARSRLTPAQAEAHERQHRDWSRRHNAYLAAKRRT